MDNELGFIYIYVYVYAIGAWYGKSYQKDGFIQLLFNLIVKHEDVLLKLLFFFFYTFNARLFLSRYPELLLHKIKLFFFEVLD